jgi:Ca2+-binding EF-hand superfamily protein
MASELQRRKWPNLFHLFDANVDGAVSQDDVESMADRIAGGQDLKPGSPEYGELRERFMRFWDTLAPADTNHDGRVEPQEWTDFWSRLAASGQAYHQVVQPVSETVFSLLDANGDGQITYDEFRHFYGAMGVGEDHAREIFARLGRRPQETISREEAMVLTDQYFVGDEPDAPGNWFFGSI